MYCTFIRSRWGAAARSSSTSTALRPISCTGCSMVVRLGSGRTSTGLRFSARIFTREKALSGRCICPSTRPTVCSLLMT